MNVLLELTDIIFVSQISALLQSIHFPELLLMFDSFSHKYGYNIT